jgi:mediator of RNA polymerase II transcription subunit 23
VYYVISCGVSAGSESTAGNWCKEMLSGIMAATPLSWPSYTLACFPSVLSDFFQQQVVPPREDKQTLKRNVEVEYRRWKSEFSVFFYEQ